jgi:ABC-2 type transport system ATP-binding protein
MTAMIEIRGLVKHFGSLKAVDGVSFDVGQGEVLGFLGPNGAGKSTTMKMVTGFLSPTAGEIRVAGHDVLEQPVAAKSAIGYLPEGAPAYPDMTPIGFLRFVAEIRGLPERRATGASPRSCSACTSRGCMHQPIETLSKGFKRRVGLAQAILHDPQVLIMDEPTDGLDPNQKHEVRGLIREMGALEGDRALDPHPRGGRGRVHARDHHHARAHRVRRQAGRPREPGAADGDEEPPRLGVPQADRRREARAPGPATEAAGAITPAPASTASMGGRS